MTESGDWPDAAEDTSSLPSSLPPKSLNHILSIYPTLRNHVGTLSLEVNNVNWYSPSGGHYRFLELFPSIRELSLFPPPHIYNFPIGNQLAGMRLIFVGADGAQLGTRKGMPIFDLAQYFWKPTLWQLQVDHVDGIAFAQVPANRQPSSVITDLLFVGCSTENMDSLPIVVPWIKKVSALSSKPKRQPTLSLTCIDFYTTSLKCYKLTLSH